MKGHDLPRGARLACWIGLIVGSWLVAIAALAAILRILPVTPGYLPDHVE